MNVHLMLIFLLSRLQQRNAFSIDFRYPDNIVDPRPSCHEEGFFPHPTNCSWFYRCHSYLNSPNFFQIDYYECAPGTIFNAGEKVCTQGHWSHCRDFDCTATCKPTTSECFTFTICDNQNNQMLIKQCRKATYECIYCSEKYGTNVCQAGLMYISDESVDIHGLIPRLGASYFNSRCIPPVDIMTCTGLTSLDLPASPRFCDNCYLEMAACNIYDVCELQKGPCNSFVLCSEASSSLRPMKIELCYSVRKRCLPCGSIQNVCSSGELFSTELQTCFKPPYPNSSKCPEISEIVDTTSTATPLDTTSSDTTPLDTTPLDTTSSDTTSSDTTSSDTTSSDTTSSDTTSSDTTSSDTTSSDTTSSDTTSSDTTSSDTTSSDTTSSDTTSSDTTSSDTTSSDTTSSDTTPTLESTTASMYGK